MSELRLSFEAFLRRFPYETWLTINFEKPASTEVAKRRLAQFFKYLNQRDDVFYQKYLRMWVFFEKNTAKKGVHVHCLIDGLDVSRHQALQRKCFIYFGETKIKTRHEGVIPYVAEKYNSPRLDDFDYMKINSRFRRFNNNQHQPVNVNARS